jgi:hypothetical protein
MPIPPAIRRPSPSRSFFTLRSRAAVAAGVVGAILVASAAREAIPAPKAASKAAASKAAKAAAKPAKEPPIRLPAAVLTKPSGTAIKVAPVDASARRTVATAAARIDDLLAKHWREHEVEPSDPLGDAHFVRRIYLELAGRIPTFDETVAFLDDRGKDKRAELIEHLLASPDYVSHFYNFWADILRLCERPQNDIFAEAYLDWVKQSIATNRPYDRWVHEMLTADGKIWENPATGYQLRDKGMPLPYVDNTVRVFLGTQIGCAQCHDHPFDSWTQHQFYELAAFTSGTRMRFSGVRDRKGSLSKEDDKAAAKAARERDAEGLRRVKETMATARQNVKDRKLPQEFNLFIGANLTSVSYEQAKLLLPHDYQYKDDKPLAAVQPHVLWGEVPAEARDKEGREQFAAWLTSRDNRQFARTIANRLWRKLMGVGLVEPVDDFREENTPSYPALLEHLTDEMLRLDFDMREFVRVVVSTQAYQRRAVLHDPTSGSPFRFTGPALRRMTAEQLWDSILTLVARNELPFQRPTVAAFAQAADVDLTKTSYAEVESAYRRYAESFSPNAYRRDINKQFGYQGQVLVRASELPTPLPLGHFLRQFGQSDRLAIEAARTIATVPQILAMFNGPITHSMLERGSVIYDEVVSHDLKQAVDVIFISLLSHRPSAEDRSFAIQEIRSAESPAAGCGNLIWALLNTREFIFIQ